MMKYGLIFAIAIALAPASALAATNGTVRMDWLDDVTARNTGEPYYMDGQKISGASGFFLFDIDNNTILDAELNILIGGNMMVARTFDETAFSFLSTTNGITFDVVNSPQVDREFFDANGAPYGYFNHGVSSIDFAKESGFFEFRNTTYATYSRQFNFNETNPTLAFTPLAVPEPSTAMLLGLASLGAFGTRRRRS